MLFRSVARVPGVRDYTCGYRAYRAGVLRVAFERYQDQFIRQTGFGCMAEILLRVNAVSPIIHEVPLILRYDLKESASKMRVGRTVRETLLLLLHYRVRGDLGGEDLMTPLHQVLTPPLAGRLCSLLKGLVGEDELQEVLLDDGVVETADEMEPGDRDQSCAIQRRRAGLRYRAVAGGGVDPVEPAPVAIADVGGVDPGAIDYLGGEGGSVETHILGEEGVLRRHEERTARHVAPERISRPVAAEPILIRSLQRPQHTPIGR